MMYVDQSYLSTEMHANFFSAFLNTLKKKFLVLTFRK